MLRRAGVAFRRGRGGLVFQCQIGRCQCREPFRGFRIAGQDHVFRGLAKGRVDGVVGLELGRIDDGHVESGESGVVEEHGVHRGPDRLVAPEGERKVGDAARGVGARQVLLDPAYGFDEIDAVAFVFGDAGSDGKYVHVEDDLFGTDSRFGQEFIGAGADSDLSLVRRGLAFFVEGHHHHRGAQVADLAGLFEETFRPFLQADGVDDAFALGVLQAGQDAVPVGRVDHQGGLGHGRVVLDLADETLHGGRAVEHCVVHIDVDDRRAAFDLVGGYLEGRGIIACGD